MKYILLFSLFIIILFSRCKNADSIARAKSCALEGRFINRTVLDQCPKKMPVDIPYYALEMTFDSTDTVDISNGIEKFRLPYVTAGKDCRFKIVNATRFGDMLFEVSNDTLIHLFDSAWTKVESFSSFVKEGNPVRQDWNFENYMNTCAMAGTYMMKAADGTSSPVYFLPNGQVSGIKPYLSYTVCYAGDCLEETETPANLIEFTDDRGGTTLFAYKKPEDLSSVQFYKLAEPMPDIKGERAIGALAFELKTGLSQE